MEKLLQETLAGMPAIQQLYPLTLPGMMTIDWSNTRNTNSTDLYNVIKAEFIAMRLAELVGLNVASVSQTQSANKDVLLIERFDRSHTGQGRQRKGMVSALTLLGLDEMMARYAGYQDLAEIIRHKFTQASITLKELFSRLVFDILCGRITHKL